MSKDKTPGDKIVEIMQSDAPREVKQEKVWEILEAPKEKK